MWVEALERSSQPTTIPTWANGTDAEIADALTRHYNGEIDLTDYWSVGDERVVHLSAIAATTDYDAQPEQDITLVLVNAGGKTLTTPINGHTECAFVVGQKDCLSGTGRFANSTYAAFGWGNSSIRTWLSYNSSYYNALPATLRGIFKAHKTYYCNQCGSDFVTTDDSIIVLPARKEIVGSAHPYDKASSYYNVLAYYQTVSNRIKKVNGNASQYWTNSKYYYTGSTTSSQKRIFSINASGGDTYVVSTNVYGIAPQMVI